MVSYMAPLFLLLIQQFAHLSENSNDSVGIAQGLSDVGPFNVGRAADKFLFGLLFLNNGVLSQLTKMGIIKKRDEVDPDADPPLRIGLF